MTRFFDAPPTVKSVIVLLALEAGVILAALFMLLSELISGNFQSFYAEVFLVVLAIGALVWVVNFSLGILRKRRWARSAAVFWQLMQAFVGTSALGSNLLLGASLLLLAAVAMFYLFTRSLVEYCDQKGDLES